ncbi:alpha/beta hydrolase [Rhizobium rosettiformans]|uniref:alpha/beta hydrolase n=1 Tax=Rhizobium rosettiformans TaxID=1368430 RepID=UPI00285D10DC|nr:alpha/beta hydrolase [Rhizobium rosettiformans]MDR7027824.1 pimeloyl-ACP methyl ester carboxylesterase [Rhizobium rosettiformans]MDR7066388.1 pimeloyl-ACP methyl ester carboxylesterase [Rhizobium rosettiformans]
MSEVAQPSVSKRAVFLVGGYERNDAAGFFRRIGREMERFCKCWSVEAKLGAPVEATGAVAMTAIADYLGPDGVCCSDITFLSFDDIVKRDGTRPFPVRLGVYLVAFFDYVFSGTMVRFFATNWRFALYFLYPFVMLVFFAWLGTIAYRLTGLLALPGGPVLPMLVGASVAYAVGRFIGRRYFVFHLMDLWSFSREHLHCRRPEMDARIDDWASLIAERTAATDYDEVLLIGHSTGGALILDVAHQLAERRSVEGKNADFKLVTVGSTSLKVALHPKAKRARERLETLARHPGIRWVEFQALTDIINFYKCDPYARAGLTHQRPDVFPRQFQVRFRDMLERAAYKRVKKNFFRVHYQFISANSRRYFYDFFMICCGTRPIEAVRNDRLPIAADAGAMTETVS